MKKKSTRLRDFLLGVLVGALLAVTTFEIVSAYDRMNMRVTYIEGYLAQLDRALRSR